MTLTQFIAGLLWVAAVAAKADDAAQYDMWFIYTDGKGVN